MTTYALTKFLSSFPPFSKITFQSGDGGSACLVIDGETYPESHIDAWFSMWENKPLPESELPEIYRLTSEIRELVGNRNEEPTESSWVGTQQPFEMSDERWDQLSIQEKLEAHIAYLNDKSRVHFEKRQWDLMIQGPGGGAWSNSATATLDQIRNIKFPIFKPDPEKPKERVGVREVIKGKVYDTDAPNTEILFQYQSPPFLGGPFYNAEMCIDEDGEIFIAGTPAEPYWDKHLGRTIVTNGGGIVVVSLDHARQVLSQHGEPGRKAMERLDAIFADRK